MRNEVEMECRYLRWIKLTLASLAMAVLLVLNWPTRVGGLVAFLCFLLLLWLGSRLNRLQQRSLG